MDKQALSRAIQDGKFETDGGAILVPSLGIIASGEYFHTVNGQDEQVDHNLLPDEALTFLVNLGFHTQSKIDNWYLALFAGAVAPAANWTAASFPATASEITSATEGYAGANRPRFNSTAGTSKSVDNLTGGRASFTIVTSGTLTVTGAALLSNQLKGSTTGILASASKFATARTLQNGDVFELGYRVTLNAA